MSIPRAALALGIAALLPFLWGVGTLYSPALGDLTFRTLGPRFGAPFVILTYGAIMLTFLSGVLWGFAARQSAALPYVLAVIPALWTFALVGGGVGRSALALAAGLVGSLALDYAFVQLGLAPEWWMRLRVRLTAVAVASTLLVIL